METPCRKDCSQGLTQVHTDPFSILKWASKYKYKRKVYKVLIRSIMTYACPTWEYVADAHFLKL
jgi:hypothetical protein